MRSFLVIALPLTVLSLACGGSDLPTGQWQPASSPPAAAEDDGGSSSSSSGGGSSGSSGGGESSGSSSSGGSSSGGGKGSSGGNSSSSGSSGGSSSGNQADVAVTLDQSTLQMQLMANTVVHVTVAPNGYSGSATLSAGTLPAGVTATFSPTSVKLDGRTSATATLTLATASSSVPGTVSVQVGAGGKTPATVSVDVQSVITIHIPSGVNNMGGTVSKPVTTAYGPYPMKIVAPANIAQSPVVVYFMNDDSVSHEIHAENPDQGFGHDPGPFGAHTMDPYVRKVTAAGSYDYYLHDQNAPITLGLVEIQAE